MSLCSSGGSIQDLKKGGRWYDPQARQIFFHRTDCDRIAVCCFNNVGKQKVKATSGLERIMCNELVKKKIQDSMDRCTGCHEITEILLKTMLNTTQSINQHNMSI